MVSPAKNVLIMRNVGLDELQAGIKIGGGNINFRHVDDITLMSESKEELKSLSMRLKEENERVSLKLNIKKTKIMEVSYITSWQIEGEKVEVVTDLLFLGSKITLVTVATTEDVCFLAGKL